MITKRKANEIFEFRLRLMGLFEDIHVTKNKRNFQSFCVDNVTFFSLKKSPQIYFIISQIFSSTFLSSHLDNNFSLRLLLNSFATGCYAGDIKFSNKNIIEKGKGRNFNNVVMDLRIWR